MNILLFSDSHRNTGNIIRAIKKTRDADVIMHLGDVVKDILQIKEMFRSYRYEIVRGNNDWSREYPTEKLLDVEGQRIFITHGHHYGVKYCYDRIVEKGKAVNANAVFFGHTHQAEEFYRDGILFLNPGSAGMAVYGQKPSYCLVRVSGDGIIPYINHL